VRIDHVETDPVVAHEINVLFLVLHSSYRRRSTPRLRPPPTK
jgi:hypothetical protein